MDTALLRVSFQMLGDEQLAAHLASAGDRLPRAAVDEFLGRGVRIAGPLGAICRDDAAWRRGGDAYWAPVHATFILGALEDESALPGLMAALRWSVRYDVDWVHEMLPSIFGPLGKAAIAPLRARAGEAGISEADRTAAIRCLAGVAAHHPIYQGEILDELRGLALDEAQPEPARLAAAEVLMAFVRPGDRAAAAAAAVLQAWSDRPERFTLEDVDAAWGAGLQRLEVYRHDWLDFYSAEAAAARRRRWDEEAEDQRWAEGAATGASWVREQLDRLLVKHEFTLDGLDDAERGDATWVAESVAEYLVWYEGVAPWRLNAETAFAVLMDSFQRRVALDHAGRVQAVPAGLLGWARFCASRGWVAPEDLADVERVVAKEQDSFIEAATDPQRRAVAREVLGRMREHGVDPRDPGRGAAAGSPLPPTRERPTSRRLRPR